MKQHKFTIIVPTRERGDTLYWCLKTLVAQDYENLEILVSDNYSQDNTKEVVHSFDDKRIRYINTGQRVDMSSNWEFALSHVTDEESYVGFLGDDDGYLPHAFTTLNKLLNLYPLEAVLWKCASFFWQHTQREEVTPFLEMPLTKNTIEFIDGKRQYEKYKELKPSISDYVYVYGAAVAKYSVYKKIKEKQNNSFFLSSLPDLYSACILTKNIKSYIKTDTLLTVMGTSAKANSNQGAKVIKDFVAEQQRPVCHYLLGNELIYAWAVFYTDSILYAETSTETKPNDPQVSLAIDKMLGEVLNEMQYHHPNQYNKLVDQIKTLLQTQYPDKIAKWEKIVRQKPCLYVQSEIRVLAGRGLTSSNLTINNRVTHCENIFDAVQFVYGVLFGQEVTLANRAVIEFQVVNANYAMLDKLHYYLGRFIAKYTQKKVVL